MHYGTFGVKSKSYMWWWSSSSMGPLPKRKKTAQGQLWSAKPSALLYTFWEPKMCTAGQRVLLTITGPGPSFFYTKT